MHYNLGNFTQKNWLGIIIICMWQTQLFAQLNAQTTTVAKKQNTASELIDLIQGALLQKNRSAAFAHLETLKKSYPTQAGMLGHEKDIGSQFFTHEAQQFYELGLSQVILDPQNALKNLILADKAEPEHLLVKLVLSRLYLRSNEVENANSVLRKSRYDKSQLPEIKLMNAQIFLAQNKLQDFSALYEARRMAKVKSLLPQKTKPTDSVPNILMDDPNGIYWENLQAEYLYKSGQFREAVVLLEKAMSHYPLHIESHFWLAKIKKELKLEADSNVQEYLKRCKSITGRTFRAQFLDPWLCTHEAEARLFLK
jgi:predicted Zn-dependent protease